MVTQWGDLSNKMYPTFYSLLYLTCTYMNVFKHVFNIIDIRYCVYVTQNICAFPPGPQPSDSRHMCKFYLHCNFRIWDFFGLHPAKLFPYNIFLAQNRAVCSRTASWPRSWVACWWLPVFDSLSHGFQRNWDGMAGRQRATLKSYIEENASGHDNILVP